MADLVATRVRFGPFTLDLRSNELYKGATRLKLPDQSIEILKALVERPGELVTREELRQRLWPGDTFVDFEHGLNAAVRRVRDALGDSADAPQYIETLPRRGYRFIGTVEAESPPVAITPAAAVGLVPAHAPQRASELEAAVSSDAVEASSSNRREEVRRRRRMVSVLLAIVSLLLGAGALSYLGRTRTGTTSAPAPTLSRLTFEPGLQMNPAISPDGNMVAYASPTGGNFDIYIQSTAPGAEARQVTLDPAHDWQPDWSPDGRIVFRSERDGGGLYVVAATGGIAKKICDFGYEPRWSPDGTRVLFSELLLSGAGRGDVYTVTVGELPSKPRPIDLSALSRPERYYPSIGWHPDGRRVTFFTTQGSARHRVPRFVTIGVQDGRRELSNVEQRVQAAFDEQRLLHVPGGEPLVWAPDRRAIYFVGLSRGVQSVWRVDVDPQTLAITGGPHRLTSMTESNEGLSLSEDGTRLVFGAADRKARVALYGLDPSGRQIVGAARIVTGEEVHAFGPDLSRDGSKFLVLIQHLGSGTGLTEIREQHLTGPAPDRVLIQSDGLAEEERGRPRWSPDGRTIVYVHIRPMADAAGGDPKVVKSLRLLEVATLRERDLTSPIPARPAVTAVVETPYGWSNDGQFVIAVSDRLTPGAQAVVLIPVRAAPTAERDMKVVAKNDQYFMWNPGMSPADEQWICFNRTDASRSMLGVMKSSDGIPKWLTGGEAWADKPRWSADGRLIYYISRQGGPFNIWALGFDPATGSPVGGPIQLTHFDGPGEQVPPDMGIVDLGVAAGRLAVPIIKPTGGIWMVENLSH